MLKQDCDGHWYVVPASMGHEFERWLAGSYGHPWIPPDWAREVGGGAENVTFEAPEW